MDTSIKKEDFKPILGKTVFCYSNCVQDNWCTHHFLYSYSHVTSDIKLEDF